MSKVKICFFSGDITRSGGTERVAILIANELCKNNKYDISFVSLTERNSNVFFDLDESVSRYKLYDKVVSGMTHLFGYINRLKKVVKTKDIDILIDIDGIIDMYAVPVKWLTKVKVISWEHFNYYFHPTGKMRELVRKFAVKHVDAIVTLTNQDKEYYRKELSFQCPICAIHNPVTYTGIDNKYARESKTIISVGRLTYQKGFDRLIGIAEKVLKKQPEWNWVILGEGEDRGKLEELIRSKKLENQLIMPGNVHNIDDWYRKASMFVMTSRFEGLPMTLLEAKYYQLPIISYDIKTGPKECVQDGINGYLIEDGDEETMVFKIIELIENEERRRYFSQHALNDTDKFSIDMIVTQWEKLLDTIEG